MKKKPSLKPLSSAVNGQLNYAWTHHFTNHNQFWPQLLVDGKYLQDTKEESDEIDAKDHSGSCHTVVIRDKSQANTQSKQQYTYNVKIIPFVF